MIQSARRVRIGIGIVAAAVILALFGLRRLGIEEMLWRILAAAGALLVTLLFVTYRALLKIVEAAHRQPQPLPYEDEDDR